MKLSSKPFLSLAFVGLCGHAVGQDTLSLSDAARLALERNPAVEAAQSSERRASLETRVAEAGRMPRLSWTESYMRSNNPVFAFGALLNQKHFTEPNFAIDSLNNPASVQNFQSLLRVEQTVFDASRTKHAIAAARLAEDLSAEQRRAREMDILLGVVRTYFGVALADQGRQVAEQTVETTKADLERARNMLSSGLRTKADVLSVEVQLAAAEQQRIQAAADVQVAQAALDDALGLPLDEQRSLTTILAAAPASDRSLDDLVRVAFEQRSDLRQAALGTELAAAQTAGAKSALWPQIVAQGAFEADRQRFVTRGGGNWLAGVSMQWDLWRGGENRAKLAASKEGEVQAEALSRGARSAAELELRRAHVNLQSATEREKVAAKAIEQAEESLRIIRNRYDSGLEEVTALLRSENALTEARFRHLASLYEQRVARAALDHAAGILTVDSESLQ